MNRPPPFYGIVIIPTISDFFLSIAAAGTDGKISCSNLSHHPFWGCRSVGVGVQGFVFRGCRGVIQKPEQLTPPPPTNALNML